MARMTQEERDAFVEDAEKKFTERLERIANDPDEWRTWVEEVAQFGAAYSIMNQFLLIEQCMTRGVEPQYFMPYGGKDGRTGWKGAKRQVRKGESGFLMGPDQAPADRRTGAGHRGRRAGRSSATRTGGPRSRSWGSAYPTRSS